MLGAGATIFENFASAGAGGGVIRLVLGADSASSDHLNVGSLIRGTDGVFLFDLVDWAITAGLEYDLLMAAIGRLRQRRTR